MEEAYPKKLDSPSITYFDSTFVFGLVNFTSCFNEGMDSKNF